MTFDKVVVYGGRDYSDASTLEIVLDFLLAEHSFKLLIQGGAKGADTLAKDWGLKRGIIVESYPANWGLHGKRAGPIRNKEMIVNGRPELGVGFPGGAGTNDMTNQLKRAKIPTILVSKDGTLIKSDLYQSIVNLWS